MGTRIRGFDTVAVPPVPADALVPYRAAATMARRRLLKLLEPLLVAVLLVIAVLALRHLLREYSWGDIVSARQTSSILYRSASFAAMSVWSP